LKHSQSRQPVDQQERVVIMLWGTAIRSRCCG
jgi:hypothetical protein